jgi:hypothetical protein
MPQGLRLDVSDVSSEPVALSEAEDFLRVTNPQLLVLQTVVASVRREAEDITRRLLTRRTVTATWDVFYREVDLPKPPIGSVQTVEYYDTEGDQWETVTEYDVRGEHLELEDSIHSQPLRVTYTAGYSSLPKPLKLQMLRDIRYAYDHRDRSMSAPVRDRSIYQQWRHY